MNRRKLLKKLVQGDLRNVAFADMVSLVTGFGFTLIRTRQYQSLPIRPCREW
jgi:hypothetical protein